MGHSYMNKPTSAHNSTHQRREHGRTHLGHDDRMRCSVLTGGENPSEQWPFETPLNDTKSEERASPRWPSSELKRRKRPPRRVSEDKILDHSQDVAGHRGHASPRLRVRVLEPLEFLKSLYAWTTPREEPKWPVDRQTPQRSETPRSRSGRRAQRRTKWQ